MGARLRATVFGNTWDMSGYHGKWLYDTVRDIMVVEQTPDWTRRAKTGWATRSTPSVGWYMGYLDRHDDTWVIAMNLDLKDEADLPLRAALTRAVL